MSTAFEVAGDGVIVTPDESLQEKRLRWLEGLESGDYKQGQNALVTQDVDWAPRVGSFAVPGTQRFCCIGVGREELTPGWALTTCENDVNDERHYYQVEDEYGVSIGVRDHLIHMNDSRYRDFRFIARFLRKVWGLTPVN